MHTPVYFLGADRAMTKRLTNQRETSVNISFGGRSRSSEVQPIPLISMDSYACRKDAT